MTQRGCWVIPATFMRLRGDSACEALCQLKTVGPVGSDDIRRLFAEPIEISKSQTKWTWFADDRGAGAGADLAADDRIIKTCADHWLPVIPLLA